MIRTLIWLLVVALIAAIFGFTGVAGTLTIIAKVLAFIMLSMILLGALFYFTGPRKR